MKHPNYITPRGMERLQKELQWLHKVERPKVVAEVSYAASLGDRSENAEYIYGKKKLRQIDGRVRYLIKRLESGRLIDPAQQTGPVIRFGATVVLEGPDGEERTWRIYGEDEVDVERGIISWRSPLAQALMGKEEGDEAKFRAPGGLRSYEVCDVRYEPTEPLEESEWRVARYTRA